jgi:hypothetical protein
VVCPPRACWFNHGNVLKYRYQLFPSVFCFKYVQRKQCINSLLPDSVAGFDSTKRFSQKLQHLFCQSVVHTYWPEYAVTPVWVMGAHFCSLHVYSCFQWVMSIHCACTEHW